MIPIVLLAATLASAADWPRFRGPNGSGVSGDEGAPPVEFGPEKNVLWKAPVPFGQSSPIVVDGRLYLTATSGEDLITLAYEAASGKLLWRRSLKRAHTHKTYKANDGASPTPTADAGGVYSFFADFGLIAYSPSGKERWRMPLGPFDNFYGMAASPVLSNGMVYLLCDQVRGSYLLAVDAANGRERWRAVRDGMGESWSTPVIYKDQVIAVGSKRVDSYHASTGEPRWWIPISSIGAMGSPAIHEGRLVVTTDGSDEPWMPTWAAERTKLDKNGDGRLSSEEFRDDKDWFEHFAWINSSHDAFIDSTEWNAARVYGSGDYGVASITLDGKGKLDASAVAWRFKRNLPYVPAPVLYRGVLYIVKSGGIVTALDARTGAVLKQGRTEQAPGDYFSSPIAAGGRIYVASAEGKVSVIRAGADWEVLRVNDMGEDCLATPALIGGRIFLRTRGALFAFGAR
ncbi:MAG: PQQ-binding-like beta-propeller repeat protein [Bryobacteraceae bacterium]